MFMMPGSRARLKRRWFNSAFVISAAFAPGPQLNNGIVIAGAGFYTIAFGPPNTYPRDYNLLIYNGNSASGKLITFPFNGSPNNSFILWPNTAVEVFVHPTVLGGGWRYTPPPRWPMPNGTVVNVDPVNGSDINNDGLSTGTRAMQTIPGALSLIQNNFDLQGNLANIQLVNATYSTNIQAFGSMTGGMDVSIGGASGQGANVIFTGEFGLIKDFIALSFHDMTFEPAINTESIVADQGGIVDINSGVTFGPGGNAGSIHMVAQNGGVINLNSGYTINGGTVGEHYYATGGGRINASASTVVTLSSALTTTIFAAADRNGLINVNSMSFTGSGAAGTTGQRYNASTGAGISTGGGGASFFPGSSAGTAASPGWYA